MSIEAMQWAKAQRVGECPPGPDKTCTGGVAAKAVLLILADYADEGWSCYPGVPRIARETEQSDKSVRRAITHLTHVGLVKVERRFAAARQTSNRYVLQAVPDVPQPVDKPVDKVGTTGVDNPSPPGQSDHPPRSTGHPPLVNADQAELPPNDHGKNRGLAQVKAAPPPDPERLTRIRAARQHLTPPSTSEDPT